ncbi:hypothetical protein [Enterobacter hormaechei]|uniref:hypothetical protein n=1 Tax=Enterobacter hormaechei TaxID=158836 RepID=UPI003CC649C3
MTLTKEWLLKKIAELEEERDAISGAVNEDAAMALAAMKMALASLTASEQEPVYQACKEAGIWVDIDPQDVDSLRFNGEQIRKVYIAPPAPVSVPDEMEMDDDFDSAFEHGKAVGWNACRAAMLYGADGNAPAHFRSRPAQTSLSPAQCGNSPVIPDGWVMVPVEPTHEMLEAGDEQFGTYDVYRRMIAAAPQQEA